MFQLWQSKNFTVAKQKPVGNTMKGKRNSGRGASIFVWKTAAGNANQASVHVSYQKLPWRESGRGNVQKFNNERLKLGRINQRNFFFAVFAINQKITVNRENNRIFNQFTHSDNTGIGKIHWNAVVFFNQFLYFRNFI